MRDRVTGEESAGATLGGALVAVAGSKGGVGTTTVALHLGLAAARMAPGRPVCLVDFDLQKGDFRSMLDTPHRRSVVDLVVVSNEISVRHLQETLYTHKDGFRLLLAPEEGEKAEDVDSGVARNVLSAVKARHALTVVDIGAVATEATAIAAEMATQVLIVTTPDVLALRGVRRMRQLWKRLGVREDEDVTVVLNRASRRREIQPDLARKVVGDHMASTTIPADFNALEAAVNTGSPSRMEDSKLRGAFEALANELEIVPQAEEAAPRDDEPRGLLARLGGERGQTTVEFMGLLPIVLLTLLLLWQIALTGYTYVAAGHAAREGARELATDPTDPSDDKTCPTSSGPRSRTTRPRPRTSSAPGAATRRSSCAARPRSRCSLRVPLIIPGIKSPLTIGSTADTSSRTASSPTARTRRPFKGKFGENGNWTDAAAPARGSAARSRPSSWACSGCWCWPPSSCGRSCSSPGRPIRPPTPPARPAASTRATATPRRPRTGRSPRACATGMKVTISGEKATVSVRIPILFPGLGDDNLRVGRSATLPS